MLDLRRLRLLRELHERGTIAAVADALRFTPSAVSQQLAVLERETGVTLLERSGRSVRLTDAARVLVGHATALLDRAGQAEADLAAALGTPAGRARIAAIQSISLTIAPPALAILASSAPQLRVELIEAEPEQALPALVLGDFDVVLADEWPNQPRPHLTGTDRHDLLVDPIRIALPANHPAARTDPGAVRVQDLAAESWVSSAPGMGWNEVTTRICRHHGGFEPDIRHRTNDALVSLQLVSRGVAVMIIPQLSATEPPPGVAIRDIRGASLTRTIFAATRTADARRPSIRTVLDALHTATAAVAKPPRSHPDTTRPRRRRRTAANRALRPGGRTATRSSPSSNT
jgi:DNA-binding transcriptional LysR family regulator